MRNSPEEERKNSGIAEPPSCNQTVQVCSEYTDYDHEDNICTHRSLTACNTGPINTVIADIFPIDVLHHPHRPKFDNRNRVSCAEQEHSLSKVKV